MSEPFLIEYPHQEIADAIKADCPKITIQPLAGAKISGRPLSVCPTAVRVKLTDRTETFFFHAMRSYSLTAALKKA